jgi:ubiquinone/menaquinone biosynthesis C-methylase UbiE
MSTSKTIRVSSESFDYLESISKKNNATMNSVLNEMIRVVKNNEAFLFTDSNTEILNANSLVELFAKRIVKENNRILGFYLRNEQVLKSMHRDMLYFLDNKGKDKLLSHPFWVEYDQIIELFQKYIYKKYKIKNEAELFDDMRKYLTSNEVEDFMFSLNRTRHKNLSIIK